MTAPNFLIPVNTVIKGNDIPEPLQFVKSQIESILEKVFIKEFFVDSSDAGSFLSIKATLTTYEVLAFKIPATDLLLVLNPSENDPTPGISEFTIGITIQNGALKILNGKSIENFSFDANELLNIITDFF